ncbi:FecCD family ABC transporter permease [Erwinia sp. V71]|uniref:FecCD family ABC transporter permease n=1 Tax=Erwinia sp. V71 TaxID=3369424 RepID=UPI003F6185BC
MRALLWPGVAVALLLVLALLHLSVGVRPVTSQELFSALLSYDGSNYSHMVIVKQRLSRLVVAVSVGAMLAAAGYTLQKVLHNPLVSPSTLGINSGASAFAVGGIYLFGFSGSHLFWPALLGALCALLVSVLAAELLGRGSRSLFNLALGGTLSASLFSSVTAFILSLDPDAFGGLLGWLVGDIGIFDYQNLQRFWLPIVLATAVLLLLSRPLDVMALGNDQAAALGVDTRWIIALVLAAAVALPVMAVTVVGPIGFVGLIVPHIARLFAGESGLRPLLLAMLLGSALVTGADILARLLLAPRLLNVGTLMALVGGIGFLAITLLTLQRGRD